LASACIDVSDGLYIDAQRMLAASGCGGGIDAAQLPLSRALQGVARQEAWATGQSARLALSGGEDYELCFCAAPEHAAALQRLAATLGERITRIGEVGEGTGLSVTSSNQDVTGEVQSALFDHFGG
jgi:thiamine-monophosphate kinase